MWYIETMKVVEVIKYPNPLLTRPSLPVREIDPSINELIDTMIETMYASKGIGLAAPQIGRLLRVIVLDVPEDEEGEQGKNLMALINPEVVEGRGKVEIEEGCLSVPEVKVKVPRYEEVVVKGLDREGREIFVEGGGLLAVALQHEIDHLNGRLIVDYLSRIKKDIVRRKLKKLYGG